MRALNGTIAQSTGRSQRLGLRNVFIVYQMTAATALTVVIGFLVAGVFAGANVELGVDPDRAWLFSLDLARDGYSRDEARTFTLGLPDRLAALNGVDRVSFADAVPFNPLFATTPVTVSGADGRETFHFVALQRIGPGYCATLGIPLLRGVELTDDQLRNSPPQNALLPVMINEAAAQRLFGDREPLGAVIRERQRLLQVVGVVRYGRPPPFATETAPTVMLPLTAADLVPGPPQGLIVVVRSRAGMTLGGIASALAKTDTRAAAGAPAAFRLRTVREAATELDRGAQNGTALFAILGVFATGLASIGLAGVTAQAVVRRRKEIGIRMALGAMRRNVLRLVMQEAIVMAAIGAVLGVAAALALGRLLTMNNELWRTFSSGTNKPLVLLAAPLLLMLVAMVTCYLPARRSSTIDPLATLREE